MYKVLGSYPEREQSLRLDARNLMRALFHRGRELFRIAGLGVINDEKRGRGFHGEASLLGVIVKNDT